MQREREGRNRNSHSEMMSDPFGIFQGFGSFGSRTNMIPTLFGTMNPFDDPFFSQPFSKMSEPDSFSVNRMQTNAPSGITIEELPFGDEGDGENVVPNEKPSLDEQPVENTREGKIVSYRDEQKRVDPTQPQTSTFSFSKVTYGGINGAYYTSTKTRTAGGDGVVVEESKEADTTTGQATHRLSRGIHDKGHSVTRKLNSDGKVDMVQTLHNLNEDELPGFEKAWKGTTSKGQVTRSDGFGMPGNSDCGSIGLIVVFPEQSISTGPYFIDPAMRNQEAGEAGL
ncbi:hypothetical protein ACFE04_017844 [Oxalis oulophora]